jgi:hypothetical protein
MGNTTIKIALLAINVGPLYEVAIVSKMANPTVPHASKLQMQRHVQDATRESLLAMY